MSYYDNHTSIDELMGKTLVEVKVDDDEVRFVTSDDEQYRMLHIQDCCEHVRVEDVCGDVADLLGNPITLAEEVSQEGDNDDYGSSTWTFYKLGTVKGNVTIRWLGESNGYYSEKVDFVKD